MSHPVNDELLETLYEEELDYFTNKKLDLERINILFTQDDINNAGAEYVDAPSVIDDNIITSPHYKYLGNWMSDVIKKCKNEL